MLVRVRAHTLPDENANRPSLSDRSAALILRHMPFVQEISMLGHEPKPTKINTYKNVHYCLVYNSKKTDSSINAHHQRTSSVHYPAFVECYETLKSK